MLGAHPGEGLDEHARALPLGDGAGVHEARPLLPGVLPRRGERVGVDAVADHDQAVARPDELLEPVLHPGRDGQHARGAPPHRPLGPSHGAAHEGRHALDAVGRIGPHVGRVEGVRDATDRGGDHPDQPRRRRRLQHERVHGPLPQQAQREREIEAEIGDVAAHLAPCIALHRPAGDPPSPGLAAPPCAGSAGGQHGHLGAGALEGVDQRLLPERGGDGLGRVDPGRDHDVRAPRAPAPRGGARAGHQARSRSASTLRREALPSP